MNASNKKETETEREMCIDESHRLDTVFMRKAYKCRHVMHATVYIEQRWHIHIHTHAHTYAHANSTYHITGPNWCMCSVQCAHTCILLICMAVIAILVYCCDGAKVK